MLEKKITDYVVSSRIRLARNFAECPFPGKMSAAAAEMVISRITENVKVYNGFSLQRVKELGAIDSECLKEKRLISKELARNKEHGAVLIREDETISIMLNEEDHIRAQCILKGMELDKAYTIINDIDDTICKENKIAFDSDLGFLTACPTNLGTGMRASVMMFLPALTINRTMASVVSQLNKIGITVRGVYGEGSQADGYLYQVSNNSSLGISEKEIVGAVSTAVYSIAEAEETARKTMYDIKNSDLIDSVYRAWGMLTNSYKMGSTEFMKLISTVKLGAYLDIIRIKSMDKLEGVIIDAQPATLSIISGKNLTADERDIFRSEYIGKALRSLRA